MSTSHRRGLEVEAGGDGEQSGPLWSVKEWRNIAWREVFRRQDWANIVFSAFLIGAICIVTFATDVHQRTFFITDATISYTPTPNTIPSWVAVFVPFVMLVATVLVGELITSRLQHRSLTDAVATALYFIADGVMSFIMGLLLTQTFKVVVGRLRPGFLSLCDPVVPDGTEVPDTAYDSTTVYKCANQDIEDARMSFPSGHASTSSNLAVYSSAYLIWCWHMRRPWGPQRRPFWEEFRLDLGNVVAKIWMLAMLSFAWGVAVSRVIDYQHNFDDILGGILLGTMCALVYVLRAIPRYKRVLSVPSDSLPSSTSPGAGTASAGGGFMSSSTAGAWGDGGVSAKHQVGGPLGVTTTTSETPLALELHNYSDAV